ncbi:hypothetical protein [Nonomuraea longicatena]|uniref:hypothetical protein n=1 Tax=Nonomuraea longicatena TaxID=83682 RepID=UPI0031D138CE
MDEVPWEQLGYWSGGGEAVAGLLREIASASPGEMAESSVGRLGGGLFRGSDRNEVYGAAPYLVPYLVELIGVVQQPSRGLLVDLVTDIAVAQPYRDVRDPWPGRDHAALARAAMAGKADELVRFLGDGSSRVVAGMARLLACLPEAAPTWVPALRARAEKGVKPTPDAGAAACVLAVAWLAAAESAEWFAGLLDSAAHRDLRAAAAVGVSLADPATDTESDTAVRLIADALADPGAVFERFEWDGDGLTPLGSALIRAEHRQRTVARDLLSRRGLREVDRALDIAWEAIRHWRAAPSELLPAVAELVRDLAAGPPSARRRRGFMRGPVESAVELIAESGQAAAEYADLLAEMLIGEPGEPWPTVAYPAVVGLARLGDSRCVPWLVAAFLDKAGQVKHLDAMDVLPSMTAHADALLPAMLKYLRSPRHGDPDDLRLLEALVTWGSAAAPLVSAIADRMQMFVGLALPLFGAIGPAAEEIVPRVRVLLDDERYEDVAAWAMWRITGEMGQAPAVLTDRLARGSGHLARDIGPLLEDLGPAAPAAVPVLWKQLDDAEHGHLYDRVAIARALWAITGDGDGLVAPLLSAITARPLPEEGFRRAAPALLAVEALGRLGSAAEAAVPEVEVIAYGRARVTERAVWGDEEYRRTARRALNLITRRPGAAAGHLPTCDSQELP